MRLSPLTSLLFLSCQAEDLRRMERLLIDHLAWQIKTPTAYSFLHLYTQATAMVRDISALQQIAQGQVQPSVAAGLPKALEPMSGQLVAKAAYLTELSMLDYQSLAFRPSQVAASALLLAQSWSEQGPAPQEIQDISGWYYDASASAQCWSYPAAAYSNSVVLASNASTWQLAQWTMHCSAVICCP